MKFVVMIDYSPDADARRAHFAEHRVYLRGLLDAERLGAAGVLAEGRGACWVLDADTPEQAREMIEDDPFHHHGVVRGYDLRPLQYWSAKAAVGQT